ncbi:MAG: hypothetical protein M1837_004379 [Sclerophora amabilis]|nr:MAG: hypothetical protein M1837_004379 [Sclerophora amabilis]
MSDPLSRAAGVVGAYGDKRHDPSKGDSIELTTPECASFSSPDSGIKDTLPQEDENIGLMYDEAEEALLAGHEGIEEQEVLATRDMDPALSKKMHLVNNAIDEIGWTGYHWKLFVLNGFGYAVDSLLLRVQAIVQPQVGKEWNPPFARGLTVALYVGLLFGALFWGITADIMGRRLAFNTSLMMCSVCAIIAGAAPNFDALALLVSLSAFGGGGNLILDTTVFLEYLPSKHQWVLTLLAGWWSLGEIVAALVAWPLMANFSCESEADCAKADNMGWRYVWYSLGTLVFVMSLLRFLVMNLKETPKYLLGQGRDVEVVETLHYIATTYKRHCSLTAEKLSNCGVTRSSKGQNMLGTGQLKVHVQGLFSSREMGRSTLLIWLSWTLIGLAYPLYNVFLPEYLASRGARLGDGSTNTTYKNYSIVTVFGILGPVLAAYLCEVSFLGRRGTMVIGALITSQSNFPFLSKAILTLAVVFLFAYTQVRTPGQNLGFNCAITFSLNIYYGCLYAYTPEVLPSAHRATGTGVAVAFNRMMGILSAVVATVADTRTSVPIFLCAGLYIVMAIVAVLFPFEPYGRRSA